MLSIVSCEHCGRDIGGPFDGPPTADIKLSVHRHCDSCRHSHSDKHTYAFCSIDCLIDHVVEAPDRLRRHAELLRAGTLGDELCREAGDRFEREREEYERRQRENRSW